MSNLGKLCLFNGDGLSPVKLLKRITQNNESLVEKAARSVVEQLQKSCYHLSKRGEPESWNIDSAN